MCHSALSRVSPASTECPCGSTSRSTSPSPSGRCTHAKANSSHSCSSARARSLALTKNARACTLLTSRSRRRSSPVATVTHQRERIIPESSSRAECQTHEQATRSAWETRNRRRRVPAWPANFAPAGTSCPPKVPTNASAHQSPDGHFTFDRVEPTLRFEPRTCCLRNSCSTAELCRRGGHLAGPPRSELLLVPGECEASHRRATGPLARRLRFNQADIARRRGPSRPPLVSVAVAARPSQSPRSPRGAIQNMSRCRDTAVSEAP